MIIVESRTKYKNMIEKKDDLFETLFNYINEFDEKWREQIVPAKDDKIEKFKKVSHIIENGYDFPESYILFLKHMGENDGGLLSELFCGTANIDDLISHYIRYGDRLYDDFEMKHNKILFFLNEMESEYYITNHSDGTHEITTNFDDTYEVDGFSESFEKMLFQIAFDKYERKHFKHSNYFGNNRLIMEEAMEQLATNDLITIVDEYAKNKGFIKTWFSDKWHYIGVKENASIYVHSSLAMSGYINGNDNSEIDELTKELCDIIGTRIQ